MSCSAGAGVLVKFSKLFVKIHSWGFVKMSTIRKHSGSNGRLPENSELKKAKESLHGPYGVIRWMRKLLSLAILGFVISKCFWFLSSFSDDRTLWRTDDKSPDSRENKAQIFLQHSNVSSHQLHALATLFSDSDQIASLQCTKEPKHEMPSSGGIACALEVRCSEKQEFTKRNIWLAENVEHKDQCPVKDANILRKLDPSVLEDMPFAASTISQISSGCQNYGKNPPIGAGNWRKKLLIVFVLLGIATSIWLFWHLDKKIALGRDQTLASMCDERARMLQDQFNVSLNHVHALAILVSTFHHGKHPSAIDQKTFGEYTERTAFERPLTSGVAYASKVLHSEREQFEKRIGWTIKKMETEDQTLVQDCTPENLDPAPVQDEYAPVIFSQETVSHIVSIDMMSGKEDRENILRARASGKGVLTSPFKLLKSNHLGVVLTFAVYNTDLPPDATPEQRIEATAGYLGASYDVPSLVEKLLHQLASKQTIVVNVYDTTNASAPINMYGDEVTDTGLLRISSLDFGDPLRKHEMHCRFKQKPSLPWTAINSSVGVLVITLLVGHIFYAAISRIAEVENDYHEVMELKARAEAADVAKSQFLATVSHEIRTPMNGVLGMLQMLMDTNLDAEQMDYAQTAHESGKDLISLINDVLDQAKIESGRLEAEYVPFDLHSILDNVLSLFSGKCNEKEIEFTRNKGHIFVSVHLADEVRSALDVKDEVLRQSLHLVQDMSSKMYNTLSGLPVVNRWKSWESFRMLNNTDIAEEPEMIKLLVTVEDTGEGIRQDAQDRIFTPFVQADSSTSRTHGGTGIGLSISRCLVDLMGGEIGFVSEYGTGSTFSFSVTFKKGNTTKWQQHDPAISEFQGLRALVIDKSRIRAEITRYHIKRLGISVDITSSMQLGCSYISNTCSTSGLSQLCMILIDKEIWSKETDLALRHLLKQQRQILGPEVSINLPKILLLTTSIGTTERNEFRSDGIVDNFLMRPLRLSVLIGCFQETLGINKKLHVNKEKPASPGDLLKEKRILVVDDNNTNRRVAEGLLKKCKVIVTCVNSGKEAVKSLTPPHNFDACLMDLQMPEMDGFEATRQVRRLEDEFNEKIVFSENVARWHVPILSMTADVIQATNEECQKCGMDGYVSKPFNDVQLYSALAKFF
ncbi:hypothetical protein JRO89_XS01G0122200 [Xanthoceras sorbifolium]|uniref:histidine kinase n=1 Tax=Xanthoceras sorbifolium TaxID=99658 RepID=A0ABQ8IIZ2_9ROSI|nr:hypothetical protein JRO89_XS01G0122200 [Xanthoceras sorbifolium]